MTSLHTHPGSCHCGAIAVAFEATRPLAALPLRRCGCSFCRRHGARTSADPEGRLTVRAAPEALNRYRFGLRTADFLLCARCGCYVVAWLEAEGRTVATLNVNLLDGRDALDSAPPLADYEGETAQARTARRLANWTPARLEPTHA